MAKNYSENRKKDNKKRNMVLLYFLIAILFISIGYATLSTMLGINGSNITVNKAVWKVFFVSVDDNKPGNISPTNGATISSDKKEITFNIQLDEIGDKYVFDAVIENQSSYDAKLQETPTVVLKSGTQTIDLPSYLECTVVDSQGAALDTNYEVKAGSANRKTITVTVEYKGSDELPDEIKNYTMSYSMKFVSE